MKLSIENLVRSGVVLAVGLPLALSLGGLTDTTSRILEKGFEQTPPTEVETLEKDLVKPCLLWAFSDSDSKLEREAMNQIDDLMGGEINHSELCGWVL